MKGSVQERKMTIQLILSVVLVVAGLALLFMGFWVNPTGIIHNSVLVAFGESGTFAGALLGIDYTYKYKLFMADTQRKILNNKDEEREENQ